ncbi:MAG: hypothetical protein AABX14_01465 [Candidatus Aenigmatarchaeota archaeon]
MNISTKPWKQPFGGLNNRYFIEKTNEIRMKHKKKRASYILPVAVIIIAAAAFLAISGKSGFNRVLEEFHKTGSEADLKTYFPDASLVFSEQRGKDSFNYYYAADENRTIIFKYYYLSDVNKTVVACDRNVTIAICPGKFSRPLTADDVGKCIVDNSTAFSLTGNAG